MLNEPNLVTAYKQVAEKISAAHQQIPRHEKERYYLGVFLAHTVFSNPLRPFTSDRMERYAREFAEAGRLVANGWMLTRHEDFSRPGDGNVSWLLSVAP